MGPGEVEVLTSFFPTLPPPLLQSGSWGGRTASVPLPASCSRLPGAHVVPQCEWVFSTLVLRREEEKIVIKV